jgi:hypothetical protein
MMKLVYNMCLQYNKNLLHFKQKKLILILFVNIGIPEKFLAFTTGLIYQSNHEFKIL